MFHVTTLSLGSIVTGLKMMESLYPDWDASQVSTLDCYVYNQLAEMITWIVCSDIVFAFKGDETPPLITFKEFWETQHNLKPEGLKTYLVDILPSAIRNEWELAFENGQQLYAARHELPIEAMTEKEKADLQNPKVTSA